MSDFFVFLSMTDSNLQVCFGCIIYMQLYKLHICNFQVTGNALFVLGEAVISKIYFSHGKARCSPMSGKQKEFKNTRLGKC